MTRQPDQDIEVRKTGTYRGFSWEQRDPHLYYFVTGREDGKQVPEDLLNNSFTDKDQIILAIEKALDKEGVANLQKADKQAAWTVASRTPAIGKQWEGEDNDNPA